MTFFCALFRRASEPYDLSKRSPESHSKSCSPASSAGGPNQSTPLNNNNTIPQPVRPDRLSDHAISGELSLAKHSSICYANTATRIMNEK